MMINKLDKHFEFNTTSLRLRSYRQELLASNLANAETPGYKAVDVDFSKELAAALQPKSTVSLKQSDARHLGPATPPPNPQVELQYRMEKQSSIDGNTVDVDTERAQFTDNALRYQAEITFLTKRIQGMQEAIKGN